MGKRYLEHFTVKKSSSYIRTLKIVFVAFVEDNATMSSISYFENRVSYFSAKPKEVDPIKLISLRQTGVSIALKYIINKHVFK